jgi:ABC-type iron transport system FetAB ATPase subunit
LFELVRDQGKFKSDFLLLDEVFDSLDSIGKEEIFLIMDYLLTKVSKIFLITHSDDIIQFQNKNIIHVKKNDFQNSDYFIINN